MPIWQKDYFRLINLKKQTNNSSTWRIFENQVEMPFYEVDLYLLRISPSVRMCPSMDKEMEDD